MRLTDIGSTAITFQRSDNEYIGEIRKYYDETTQSYVENYGTSFQAGQLKSIFELNREAAAQTNVFLAKEAGTKPGDRILDAGCGVCGPAIDIAKAFDGVQIEGITISPAQIRRAKEMIAEEKLADRINIQLGDYHNLPFTDNSFDAVMFLESMGHSRHAEMLFCEVFRVLKPGGRIYIKDVFHPDISLTGDQGEALEIFNKSYVYNTPGLADYCEKLSRAGFRDVQPRNLSDVMDFAKVARALFRVTKTGIELTDLGKRHATGGKDLNDSSLFPAQIFARKRKTEI